MFNVLYVHTDFGQQCHATTVYGALGPDEVFNIDFGQNDIAIDLGIILPCQYVLVNPIVSADAICFQIPIKFTQIVDDTQLKKGGDHGDQARSADAFGPNVADRDDHRFVSYRIN